MTTITFYKQGNIYYGFEEKGHTGYGESGDDILCAALSSMTMLIVNAIEIGYAANVDYQIDENTTDIRVICRSALPGYEKDEKKQYAVAGLMTAYYYQLHDLLDDYYDYLNIEEKEELI